MSKIDFTVRGAGNSLWDKSNGTYHVNRWDMHYMDDGGTFGELRLFGKGFGLQYTDTLIEKEVKEYMTTILEAKFNRKVKYICWSEQGMQPRGGWSFDVGFAHDLIIESQT